MRCFRADQQLEERIFMGDTTFRGFLDGLTDCPHPLVHEFQLTSDGEDVLAAAKTTSDSTASAACWVGYTCREKTFVGGGSECWPSDRNAILKPCRWPDADHLRLARGGGRRARDSGGRLPFRLGRLPGDIYIQGKNGPSIFRWPHAFW
jgi:hypothetical protein